METTHKVLKSKSDRLLEGLQSHPELMDRFLSILSLAEEPASDGKIRSADEVEALLIQEVRKLGRESMKSWASKVDTLVGEQTKEEDSSVKLREKKL